MRPVEVIHLSYRDHIDTIRELLLNATTGAQVWLVAPWGLRATRDLVNLKLLRRTADAAALDLRLVSSHLGTRTLAREAGIPVYTTVPLKLRRYKRERPPASAPLAARIVPVEERLGRRWERRPHHFGLGTAFLTLLVIALLAVFMVGVAVVFIPSATVELRPQAQPVSGTLTVTARPTYREIDYGKAVIPARVVQIIIEGRDSIVPSGATMIPDAHAAGEVVLINRTSELVRVPKGTVVRTGAGVPVRFQTLADVELPPRLYSNVRVGIIAIEPGPSGNVKALTINIVEGELATRVDVINDAATAGGSLRAMPVVAYEDFDRLRTAMIAKLQQQAYNQLVAELEEGEFIPPEAVSVQVMAQKFDQVVGQQTEQLSMSMKVVARGLVVDGQSLKALVGRFLESRAGEGMALIPDSLSEEHIPQVRNEENAIVLQVSAKGMVAPVVDVSRIRSALRGKPVDEAAGWLRRNVPLAGEPRIVLEPPWWQYMPALTGRLRVNLTVEGG